MTLLANRPIDSTETRTAGPAPLDGAYVTTRSPRPATVGSYVATEHNGRVPAPATRGRYVSLGHPPVKQSEGRYTDRG